MAASSRRRRRQAQQRAEREARRRGGDRSQPDRTGWEAFDPFATGSTIDWAARAHSELVATANGARRTRSGDLDDAALDLLCRRLQGAPAGVVDRQLRSLVTDLVRRVRDGGWTDHELREGIVRRLGGDRAAVLDGEPTGDLRGRLSRGLAVCVLLTELPLQAVPVPRPARERTTDPETSRRLATVRALLAKAERTEFAAEAEALSAKAQSMITKFALDKLVADREETGGPTALAVSRIWLDAPYVMPKAMLVSVVARANRCRAAVSDAIGLCTVFGDPDDLDYVDLLVTSLLVQASRAMLQHGRQAAPRGQTRTRSFRQSFLVAYATRIGERLHEARAQAEDACEASLRATSGRGRSVALVVRDHEERVSEEFSHRFPTREIAGPTVTDGRGWQAGVAAADLAALDVHAPVTRA